MDDAVEQLRRSLTTHLDPRVFEALRAVTKRRKTMVFLDKIPPQKPA